MRTQALCTSLSFKRLSLAAAIVAGALTTSAAQAAPFSAYIGATAGLSPSAQNCEGYSRCDRVAGGAKVFAGWNVTSNVAAEINYFYFGSINSAPNLTDKTSLASSAKALSLGMNWSFEIFEFAASNLRAGVARVRNTLDLTNAVGVASHEINYTTSPYIGAGMSFPFNRNVRMVMGVDFIPVSGAGNRNRYMLSGGLQTEF